MKPVHHQPSEETSLQVKNVDNDKKSSIPSSTVWEIGDSAVPQWKLWLSIQLHKHMPDLAPLKTMIDALLGHGSLQVVHTGQLKQHSSERKWCTPVKHAVVDACEISGLHYV